MLYNLLTSMGSIEFDTFDKIESYKKSSANLKVSVILPTYKEELLIGKIIDAISKELHNYEYEIIIVDDSSPDNTVKEVMKKMDEFHLKQEQAGGTISDQIVLLSRKKKGVFSAQLDGIRTAVGEIIVLMDADFSHPPSKLKELINTTLDYDLVSGSRFLKESNIIAPFTRKYSTISLNLVLRRLLRNLEISDYTSIFLAARKNAWNKLEFQYDSNWGEAGMEIFKQARINNLRIKEIPFTYNYREEGESKADNLLKYGFIYLKRALQIKFFYGRKNG